jgi:DNA-binding transcriptional LysR family regulator
MKTLNFTLHQLEAFLAVARFRSFSDAARSLFTSQPSLTLLVKNLEEALRVKLFHRTTRRVEITAAGQELLPIVERAIAELELARENLSDLEALRRGKVAIGALPSGSADLVPHALQAFIQRHPEVRVTVKDAVADELIKMVRVGEVDFAIGSTPELEPDIQFAPIARDTMHLVCRENHRLARRREVAWSEIADEPFIAMTPGTSVRHASDSAFAQIKRAKKPDYEVGLLSTMFGLARAGVGVTALPTAVLRVFNVNGVATAPLVSPVVNRDLGFITRRGRDPSPAAIELMVAITNEIVRQDALAEVSATPRRRRAPALKRH